MMEHVTAADVAEASGGTLLLGERTQAVRHISLDSRSMAGDDLFVPLIGERVDSHRFLCQAIEAGAVCVYTSRHRSRAQIEAEIAAASDNEGEKQRLSRAAWIAVEDTKQALQAFGGWLRQRRPIPLVGITGSVGKTTTREMVALALSAGLRVFRTPGNSNSQVGVPVTLSEIPEDAQIGVIELGMSEPGEMTRIARAAQVSCAVITNIGLAHIEQLGSQERIREEKLHIQDGMDEQGILFLNGDDPLLREVTPEGGRRRIRYGMAADCDYRGEELALENGFPVFTAVHAGERVRVRLHVMGSHMVSNALAALAVADTYGIPMERAAERLAEFTGYQGRQQITRAHGITIIDDSYNASPVSMKAGLEVLRSMPGGGRKIAVLADMKELGTEAPRYHREIGTFLGAHPVDQVVLFGELSAWIGAGMRQAHSQKEAVQLGSIEEVEHWLKENLREGDCVLLKGSNSMGLSKAAAYLKKQSSGGRGM